MKSSLGNALAVMLLVTTTAAGQTLSERPAKAFGNSANSYQPITGRQRLHWFTRSTIGPESLAAGLFTAGFGTATNRPREYGPHWEGFGQRYGMRFTGIATGNAIEASVGALWGEDPRYFRATDQSLKGRIKNVVVMTFAARQAEGNLAPAYARYIGIAGNNFLSNTGGLTANPAWVTPVCAPRWVSPEGWAVTPLPSSGPRSPNTCFTRIAKCRSLGFFSRPLRALRFKALDRKGRKENIAKYAEKVAILLPQRETQNALPPPPPNPPPEKPPPPPPPKPEPPELDRGAEVNT
jgi:hypothetical protein